MVIIRFSKFDIRHVSEEKSSDFVIETSVFLYNYYAFFIYP